MGCNSRAVRAAGRRGHLKILNVHIIVPITPTHTDDLIEFVADESGVLAVVASVTDDKLVVAIDKALAAARTAVTEDTVHALGGTPKPVAHTEEHEPIALHRLGVRERIGGMAARLKSFIESCLLYKRLLAVKTAETVVELAESLCRGNGPGAGNKSLPCPVGVHDLAERTEREFRNAGIFAARNDEVEFLIDARGNENFLVKNLLEGLAHGNFKRMANHPRISDRKVSLRRPGDGVRTVGRGDLADKVPVAKLFISERTVADGVVLAAGVAAGHASAVGESLTKSEALLERVGIEVEKLGEKAALIKLRPPGAKRLIIIHKALLYSAMARGCKERLFRGENREERIAFNIGGIGLARELAAENINDALAVLVGTELNAALETVGNGLIDEPLALRLHIEVTDKLPSLGELA